MSKIGQPPCPPLSNGPPAEAGASKYVQTLVACDWLDPCCRLAHGPARPGLMSRTAALCAAEYRAQQVGDAIVLFAVGVHPVAGYSIFWERSPVAAVGTPEFSLWHVPPAGLVTDTATPFAVQVLFPVVRSLAAVVVSDASGRHEVAVEHVPVVMPHHGER